MLLPVPTVEEPEQAQAPACDSKRPPAGAPGPSLGALGAYVWPYRLLTSVKDKSLLAGAGMTALIGVVMIVLSVAAGSAGLGVVAVLGWVGWAAAWFVIVRAWWAYRTSPRRDHHLLLSRSGIATVEEVRRTVADAALVRRAGQLRPALAATRAQAREPVRAGELSWLVGTSRTEPVCAAIDVPVYLAGPARSGKGLTVLISAIMEAPGSVVTTSTRADNMEATIAARAQAGPVYVFDPDGVCGRATTLRWDLLAGCEDPAVAQRRAAVLVAKVGFTGENQVWATSSGGIVQCLLHAAAVSGRRAQDVHRWSTSPEIAREVVSLLERYSPDSNWSETIAAIQAEDAKMRSNKWFGVESAFKALDVPSVRAVFDVGPDEAFDPEAFLRSSGTIYMISRWRDTAATGGSVGAFFSLVLDDIAQAVRTMSQQPGNAGRQDPPCGLVLDEIANIHPWPGLPLAVAAGSGEGLYTVMGFQSRSQSRDAYGTDTERSLWENSTILLLGGGSDHADLKELSELLGDQTVSTASRTWGGGLSGALTPSLQDGERDKALVSVDELRRLPERVLLMVQGRLRPIVVTTIPWPERHWAPQVHASKAWHNAHPRTGEHLAEAYPTGPVAGEGPVEHPEGRQQ
ncbi:type IV secretory system conjugative DNA transfer family protein [Occultella kanbiaonis]|uniref:type IV secretory system conjugative DNA transfer family protein n=1 Tax=Occultella kanbiaonis TaxID=2675754 RepID=UPI0012B6D60D|nr:TraM recognition domain-containing protein [Occultella kanbiaonis]